MCVLIISKSRALCCFSVSLHLTIMPFLVFPDLYVVEFQKRGLPHIHALVWLKQQTRDPTANLIDGFVSVEIPDIRTDPLGYALVEEFMIHGPCGKFNPNCPCMKENTCSKRYPKSFNDETFVDNLGFPVYRRRDDGRYIIKTGVRMDNTHVVPYNLNLLKKFQGHLNVEWCNKSNLLKYPFKYLTKGHDKARVGFYSSHVGTDSNSAAGIDEIDEYIKCRSVFFHTGRRDGLHYYIYTIVFILLVAY